MRDANSNAKHQDVGKLINFNFIFYKKLILHQIL
jgi:hypothetical protein